MCAPLDCGPPDVTAHLQTTSLTQELGNLVNGQVRHTCPKGFATSRDGDRIRRCESRCNRHTSGNWECRRTSARWTGTPPSCSRIPCAATTAPPSGKIITSELAGEVTNITNGQRAAGVYGTKLTFGCNDGFKMLGAGGNTFECGPASQWLGRKPICVPVCLNVRCPRRSEVCVQDPHDAHKPKCVCQTWDMCPDDYSPVCGTDASEHDNRCLARVEECASNTTIDVAREGFCERAGKCHEEKPRPPPNRNCAETRYRYFYDNSSRTCRSMYVGRCYTAGGDNSFQHLSQCMTTCEGGNACDQSPDPGPCKQMTERFYYDSSENTCKSFQYGGCFGNENNFASKKSCENTCRGVKCPAPASIVNGAVSVADRSVGSTAAFTCDEGYRLRGEAQTQCQQTGNWSNAVPACVAQCPPARCSSEDRLPCSQEGIRPIHACAAGALRNTDIAILARLRRDTEDCSNNQHVTFKMRVRSELYRSARCSFLPSTDRYDVTVQLRLEDGCPCPLAKYDTWYMITAVCNEQQRLLTLHDQSIFKPRTDKALRNLINRCGYSQR
ncbi:E-selectin-like [Sycon ciliatum]|uniref:E-selectin-like n=1 Tax=Sycon ciliatum TaxID=27933 RepID=UPI0031F67385